MNQELMYFWDVISHAGKLHVNIVVYSVPTDDMIDIYSLRTRIKYLTKYFFSNGVFMIGKTISHYKIIEKLGGGGMGIVYKAQDLKLDRFVALKFLPPAFSLDEETKQRFIHEAKAASSLQHNNICTIHEIDETEDGQLFICMDCYEGETLKEKDKIRFIKN